MCPDSSPCLWTPSSASFLFYTHLCTYHETAVPPLCILALMLAKNDDCQCKSKKSQESLTFDSQIPVKYGAQTKRNKHMKHSSIFTFSASRWILQKKKKILPKYLSSSQRGILSPVDSRNPGTIINMWPEAQTHWHRTASQMRNREVPNPIHIKGLLTLSVGKSTDFKGDSKAERKQNFGYGGSRWGKGYMSPLFQSS